MIATPFLSVFCSFGNPLLRLVQDLSYHTKLSHVELVAIEESIYQLGLIGNAASKVKIQNLF